MERLHRLRILREVAARGSFTRAAEALGLSQPSVSQQVAALEQELRAPLVERSVSGARLTPAGEIALRHGLRILRTADEARAELDALRTGAHAPVRVAAFSTACAHLLPAAAGALRRHAGMELALEECDAATAVERVRGSDADLAIAFDYAAHPLDLDGLVVRHLGDDPVLLALPEDHPAAGADVVEVAALSADAWISGTGFACRESLATVCGAAGFAPRVALDSNRYATTLALVAAGHGLALVPELAWSAPVPGVVLRPLQPSAPPRRLWAATLSEPDGLLASLVDELAARGRGAALRVRSARAAP